MANAGHKKKHHDFNDNPPPPAPPPPPPPPYTWQAWFVADNAPSITQFGLREKTITEIGPYASAAKAQEHAQFLVDALSRNEQVVTLEIADVDDGKGPIFAQFREGDAIHVSLSNSGRGGNMRVRSRAYDGTRGTMLVGGEANLL